VEKVIARLAILLALSVLLLGCLPEENGLITAKGTVRYLDLEGGFYGIVADDGTHYDPGESLPEEFRRDGLRVRFTARPKEGVTIRMWGKLVEIEKIERI